MWGSEPVSGLVVFGLVFSLGCCDMCFVVWGCLLCGVGFYVDALRLVGFVYWACVAVCYLVVGLIVIDGFGWWI